MMLFMPELSFGKSCHRSISFSRSSDTSSVTRGTKKETFLERKDGKKKQFSFVPTVFASMVKVTNFSLLLAPGVTLEVCRVFSQLRKRER